MQWSIDRNGALSRADPASLVLPPIMDPHTANNAETQAQDPHSLLNWTWRILAVQAVQGVWLCLKCLPTNRRILAYTREYTREDGHTEIIPVRGQRKCAAPRRRS